ncbi:MAG: lipocalin family protein [Marinobacter sp.]|uniref:lipocalin family protein n=1 Tax=Marinobacter sp. TaxID=50741 RepID=UPI00299DAE3D|nr:lipocalin family protein [Marinobacter sp.]MDX1636265.1 lipocalin family protein [Marinobacter sp.]
MTRRPYPIIPALLIALLLAGCVGRPEGIQPVTGFDKSRYLGTWYEIARLDHSFEEGLSRVTADYSLREDGGIAVINRGYSEEEGEWSVADGKAYFVEDEQTGYLKVSFFGPFYGAYVIFGLDKANYEYAFVSGPSRDYLWLLARSPQVSDQVRADFLERADRLGFNTGELIFVDHSPIP